MLFLKALVLHLNRATHLQFALRHLRWVLITCKQECDVICPGVLSFRPSLTRASEGLEKGLHIGKLYHV